MAVSHTEFSITADGRAALKQYWEELDAIRTMREPVANARSAPVTE